ncbi:MAG: hypothetical protein ACI88Z_000283, partial [Sphingobacteriales bacterium]
EFNSNARAFPIPWLAPVNQMTFPKKLLFDII